MAWRITKVKDQRKQFIKNVLQYEQSFTDICEEFGISRQTGYKWLRRYKNQGESGLEDRKSSRHTQDRKTSKRLEYKILTTKQRYSSWGYKKIHAHLMRHEPDENWPSKTTVGNVLK